MYPGTPVSTSASGEEEWGMGGVVQEGGKPALRADGRKVSNGGEEEEGLCEGCVEEGGKGKGERWAGRRTRVSVRRQIWG